MPHIGREDVVVYVYPEKHELPRPLRLEECAAHYADWRGLPFGRNFTVERQTKGRPFFAEQPDIHFSISHSGAYWLAAFHGEGLGLDIQQHTPRACADIAKRWYHQNEYTAVLQYGEACFFDIWSAKESLCKATGRGIDATFPQFSVVGPNGALLKRCEGWQLRPFPLCGGYSACLCIKKDGPIHIIRTQCLQL